MPKPDQIKQIMDVFFDIEKSNLTVNQYFKTKKTPFSQKQYYIYKKKIQENGINELIDKRIKGNNLKLTPEVQSYIKGLIETNRSIKSLEIEYLVRKEFNVDISRTTINGFRKENNLIWIRAKKELVSKSSGGEILIALALYIGLIDKITDFLYQKIQNKKRTKMYRESSKLAKDHLSARDQGKFTSSYSKLKEVRESRFKSIEEKIDKKRFVSMNIFKLSKKSLRKYVLALFSLPLVTRNGRARSVNNVIGNDLEFLSGFNYKAATLDKFIGELKYLQLSNDLIEMIAEFWLNFWKKKENLKNQNTIFACYYIDGNTKALWSQKPCHKGKVTMLGRVMNSLEQVFIHDGKGHPIYFQTFNGHADIGKNGLKIMDKLTDFLGENTEKKNQFTVNRILVMDGGGNAVGVIRHIQDYYYITILDDNQVTNRKIKSISSEKRYEYGLAFLTDCQIELIDSKDKEFIYETRAVQVKWDNGRNCTLITNLPTTLFSTDNVVKSYFNRWPMQELDFKDTKKGVNIHRIVGYGKKLSENTNLIEKISTLQKSVLNLEEELEVPLNQIKKIDTELQQLIKKETQYREKSSIINGNRVFKSKKTEQQFHKINKEINKLLREKNNLKKGYEKQFKSLEKKKKELARIIDKKKIYQVDVELDQLMTCFKLSFANVCSYFLEECFEGQKMNLETLYESVFNLRGQSKVKDKVKKIILERNDKQPQMMEKLSNAFHIINNMEKNHFDAEKYYFEL